MVPSLVGQQPGSAADAAAAAVAGAPPAAPGHAGDSAASGDPAAFDSALSSACGTSSVPAAAGKTGRPDKCAASSPTFPAWILALGFDLPAVGSDNAASSASGAGNDAVSADAKAAPGETKADRQEAGDEDATPDEGNGAVVVADVSALTLPIIVDALPVAVSVKEDSAQPGDMSESAHNRAGAEDAPQRTSGSFAQVASTRSHGRVEHEAGQQQNDDLEPATIADPDAPAVKGEVSADPNGAANMRRGQTRTTAGPIAIEGETAAARTEGTPAAAPVTEVERIVSGQPASVQPASASPSQIPRQGMNASATNATAGRANEAAKANLAAPAAPEASTALPPAQSPSPSPVAVSISAGEPAQAGQRPSAVAADVSDTVPTHPAESSSIAAAAAATGGRNQSFQHADADSLSRNAAPDPPSAGRTMAWSAAMSLVAAPDGTLRLASPLATSVLAASLPRSEPAAANLDQMVQTMRVMVKGGISEATVHLHPEHFGDMSIQVRVDGKTVSAIVHTESAGVREWLQGQEATLRGSLLEHGLQLDRLVVQRDGRQDRRQQTPHQQEPARRRARPEEDAQQTFEVTV